MSGYIVTWDEVASSTIPDLYVTRVERGMWGEVRDSRISMPGRDGAWLFTENRGLRRITAELVRVRSSGERLRETVVDIADWLDKSGEKRLVFDDQPDRYWKAALASAPSVDEWMMLGKATVEWLAQPYAFAVSLSEVCASATSGGSHSWTPADQIEAYPEVVITANGGAASGIEFTMNGDTLTFDSAIGNGQSLTISSLSYTVITSPSIDTDLTGAFDPGALVMAPVSGDFPLLLPGLNSWSVTYTGSATSVTVCVRWRRRYR